jgi:anhydro-N-acetylmuramic acid kinase
LGGMGNVTSIDRKRQVDFAFDTGPANMLIDLKMRQIGKSYDKNGATSAKGIASAKVVSGVMSEKFFKRKPPKSCGREEFGEIYLQSLEKKMSELSFEDQMATLTDITAASIAKAIESLPTLPAELILCGGGAKNEFLKDRIQFFNPKVKVHTCIDLGWPAEAIEGAAFALLAAARVWGVPANIPRTTGAKKAVLLGKIIEI